jgi:hypothetical protein
VRVRLIPESLRNVPFCGVFHPFQANITLIVGSVESMVNVVSDTSVAVFPTLSLAVSRTKMFELLRVGRVQSKLPSLVVADTIEK